MGCAGENRDPFRRIDRIYPCISRRRRRKPVR
jgi:hypothetical protein